MSFALLGFEVTPLQGLAPWAIAYVFGAYFLGFFIRGVFGFGSNLPIVLMTTWVLAPHHAILLVTLTAIVSQVALFPQAIRTADWPIARPLILGIGVGVVLGTWIFVALDADWLIVVMGVLVLFIIGADKTCAIDPACHGFRHGEGKVGLPSGIVKVIIVEMDGAILVGRMSPTMFVARPIVTPHATCRHVYNLAMQPIGRHVHHACSADVLGEIPPANHVGA